MYPRLMIHLPHLQENVNTVRTLCAAHGISIAGITKVFRGDPTIAQVLVDGGITMLGDSRVANLARMAGERTGTPLSVISGGNSATIDLMLRGGIPAGVNTLRLGESLLFGRERSNYQYLPGTHRDVFTLECQIVEVKDKPSLPWGTVGVDSYGRKPEFVDRGLVRRKAVCALGRQDFDAETTTVLDPGVILLGASSDHLMLDVTDSEKDYRVGDVIRLQLGYFSTMRAFTSDYVEKVYLED